MKKHIIFVDDEENIRDLCKEILEEAGYKVTLAAEGKEALEKMDYEDFDLYLVDMVMPEMDGLELIKRIKEKQPLAVIIVTTGYSSIEGAVKAVHAGAFQYIAKPINPEELLKTVSKGLQYAEDLYGPFQKALEPGGAEKGEPFLLNGFPARERQEFLSLGVTKKYNIGDSIPIRGDQPGSIILVEEGEISVWLNNTSIDYLRKADSWGEESFVLSDPLLSTLRVELPTKARHFTHEKLLEFFNYHETSLLNQFMVNIVNSIFYKWRKSVQRIVMLKLITGEK
jgi:CheY-like chemotaxis protein